MKIILSRKGLDSGFKAATPSPILSYGRLLSLPIPLTPRQMRNGEAGIPYADLRFDGQPISEIINQLSRGRFDANRPSHPDPDLDRDRLENRRQGWRPAFGQVGPAQSLLENVGAGDLFLFFGWFRHTILANEHLRYQRPVRDLHVVFGWLQVGQRFHPVTKNNCPRGLEDHLHVRNADAHGYGPTNTIYIAADELIVSGQRLGVRSAGTFPCFKPSLQLTAPEEEARSHWSLPRSLCTDQNHGAWPCHEGHVPFDSHSRGRRQEFVFDVPEPGNQEAINWLKGLFEDCC